MGKACCEWQGAGACARGFLGDLFSGAHRTQGALGVELPLSLRHDMLCLGHSLLEPPAPTVDSTPQ